MVFWKYFGACFAGAGRRQKQNTSKNAYSFWRKKYCIKYMECFPMAGRKDLDMIIQLLSDINQLSLSGLFRVVSADFV